MIFEILTMGQGGFWEKLEFKLAQFFKGGWRGAPGLGETPAMRLSGDSPLRKFGEKLGILGGNSAN